MVGFRWLQCRRVRPALWDYASERLSEGPMELVEQHIARCGSCKHELDSLRQTQEFLAACRAEDEVAPRSTWNTLRQRLLAETQSSLPDPMFHQAENAERSPAVSTFDPVSVAWNRPAPRAVWPMYLMTSMAGGFAAVALIAVSYGLMTLHKPASPSSEIAEMSAIKTEISASSNPEAERQQVLAHITGLLKNVQTDTAMVVTSSGSEGSSDTSKAPVPNKNNTPQQVSTGTGIVSGRLDKRVAPTHAFAIRADQKQARTSARQKKNGLKFRHYTPRPDERLPEITQVATRSGLEHVRPVGNESDESDIYVVGTVQPASRDEDNNY